MNLKIIATNLYVHELFHLFSGVILFIFFYLFLGDLLLATSSFLTSLLIDLDHYFESLIICRLSIIEIIRKNLHNTWKRSGKMTIFFHSWEFVFVIIILGKHFGFYPLAVSISAAAVVHYLIDTLIYSNFFRMPVYQYFLIYRAYNKFDFVKLCSNGKK